MNNIVKENQDGTVTIDREAYNELRNKSESYDKLMNKVADVILKNLEEFLRRHEPRNERDEQEEM